MVDAVHVDRDQHRLQPPLHPLGKADIPVLDAALVNTTTRDYRTTFSL
jgi:hypothetical protein